MANRTLSKYSFPGKGHDKYRVKFGVRSGAREEHWAGIPSDVFRIQILLSWNVCSVMALSKVKWTYLGHKSQALAVIHIYIFPTLKLAFFTTDVTHSYPVLEFLSLSSDILSSGIEVQSKNKYIFKRCSTLCYLFICPGN